MGVKLAEILDPNIVVGMGICRKTADIVEQLELAHLVRDRRNGWETPFGMKFALRKIMGGGSIAVSQVVAEIDWIKSEPSKSVTIDNPKFFVASSVLSRLGDKSFEFSFFEYEENHPTDDRPSYFTITDQDLPIKFGVVPARALVHTETIEFRKN